MAREAWKPDADRHARREGIERTQFHVQICSRQLQLIMTWLNRYAKLVAVSTLLLIGAGGMVTSTGSGLSVPDWPNTYGWFMFTFPMSKWVGGIRYEHAHRLIASTVGFLTIILAIWTWRVASRPWVRRLGVAALGA